MPSNNNTRKPRTTRTKSSEPIAVKRAQIMGSDAEGVDPYAPTIWGAQDAAGALVDLTLPSGQRCLAQRMGPEGLMAAGLLDDLDSLAPALTKVTSTRPGAKTPNLKHLMTGAGTVKKTFDILNRVAVAVVIKPELTPEPEDPADKEIGKIYPSSVALEDKMFLFDWAAGGSSNLDQFRRKLEKSVASVDAEPDVEVPAE